MSTTLSDPTASRGGHPVLRALAAFPIACLTCALFTDLAYVQTANIMWSDFSAWLLAIGTIVGALALVVGIVSWLARRGHAARSAWIVALGSLLTLVVAFFNNLVHTHDAWTSVVPTGLALSAATVLAMLATAWIAASVGRRQVAVAPYSGVRQ